MNARLRALALVLAAATAACGPVIAHGTGGASSESGDTSADGLADATLSTATSTFTTSTNPGTSAADDGPSSSSDGGNDTVGFIAPTDGGGGRSNCSDPPRWPGAETQASCSNGSLDAGETCYRALPAICEASGPLGIVLADFGGGPVVAHSANWDEAIQIRPATAEGLLAPPVRIEIQELGYAGGLQASDVDGDGISDLLAAAGSENALAVFIALGDGTFAAPVTYGVGFLGVDITLGNADVSPGGDVFVLGGGIDTSLAMMAADGDAGFVLLDSVALGVGDVVWWAAADLELDGLDEVLAIVDYRLPELHPELVLFPNVGGGFGPSVVLEADDTYDFAIGRVDADALPDLVLDGTDEGLRVRLGLGDGSFAPAVVHEAAGPVGRLLAVVDLDGDGNPELVGSGHDTVVMPITPAGFGDAVTIALGEHYYPLRKVAFGDANADGVLDIAAITAVGQTDGSLHLMLSEP